MSHLSRLTPEQQAAALAPAAPLLLLAGPGSGKTAVLAARIADLVGRRGLGAASVLALTFAARAARELRARLDGVLGDAGRAVDVATFHSLGLRIARAWRAELGYGPGPLAVYGEAEARALLREVAAALGFDPARLPLAELARAVERHRLAGDGGGDGSTPLALLADRYEARLRQRGAIDYPAMLLQPLRLLRERPDVARFYQLAYRAVLVDEAQDLCGAQYALARLLAAGHRCLTLVGDPHQAVFGWRGADGAALRHFARDFPEATALTLRRNFRSTPEILRFANALGASLPGRRELWTANPPGPLPVLHAAPDEWAEAGWVAQEIARLCREGLVGDPGEVAVLYRTNRQADPLVTALRARRLPYHLRGGGDLFARREVRDALAYLRLALNPADGPALARIVDVPPRGLGRLAALLSAGAVPLAELARVAARIDTGTVERARALAALLDDLHRRVAGRAPAAALDLALGASGYRGWLAGRPDGADRLGHLTSLRRLAEAAEGDLAAWLADVALGDVDDAAGDPHRVRLLTVHGAKGGEWPAVFVTGWEDGLLPHAGALREATDAALDGERCVAYVAVTRPRCRLYLTCCRSRQRGDARVPRHPSRFLTALPADLVAAA